MPAADPGAAVYTRRRLVLLSCGVLVVAGSVGYWWWSIESEMENARQAIERGDWKPARAHLTRYLDWHPQDPAAHLLMAEALVKDDSRTSDDFVQQAIEHLHQIGDDAPLSARARLQEARLALLILREPARAEHLLRRSLKLNPDSYEANFLMWKVLDLTGRHINSREYFWRVYELSPETERASRLRDWFFAEFYSETANEPFTRALGAEKIGKIPASVNLLVRFRESEPAASFVHAALAAYYLESGKPKSSLELLKEAPDLAHAMQDPFFVAALFEALVDLGEFQKAKRCFEQFPRPHSGYLFWRCEGIYRQHVLNDAAAAVEPYTHASTCWPAKFDWNLMMRLSECLRKVGRNNEAERVQSRVKHLTTKVLTRERTSQLRNRVGNLNNPFLAQEICSLYREFGLTREADAWEEHRQSLLRYSP
ncbi:MAG: hypothetical protein CMJ48_00280 [Planctomycetaceae bacterium]|nr:hypothetical protein [Planctomycetaceae bacterium]